MSRRNHDSGSEWERFVGYSRTVRVGDVVMVAGTTSTDAAGKVVAPGDPYRQTVQTLRKIRTALEAVGSQLEHVVRTRIFVTDIENWKEVGRAHEEFFGTIRPATTMVEVSRLVDPAMLVEVEAEAIAGD